MSLRNPLIPNRPLPPADFPRIEPVPDDPPRPFWSVMVPTYNRPEYLRETLDSILKQAPGADEMQIMVVDNGSTVGDIEAIVREIGGERIEYHRHPENIGLNANWTSCIQLSRGRYVHLMHDDDMLMPGFYDANLERISKYGCNIMFTQAVMIDDDYRWRALTQIVHTVDGIVPDPYQIIFSASAFTLNSMIVARDLYEKIGGYHRALHYGCDHEICSRLFQIGTVGYVDKPLVMAREHQQRDVTSSWYKADTISRYLTGYQYALSHQDTAKNRAAVYNVFGDVLHSISNRLLNNNHFRAAFRAAVWSFRVKPSEAGIAQIIYVIRMWLTRSNPIMRAARRLLGIS